MWNDIGIKDFTDNVKQAQMVKMGKGELKKKMVTSCIMGKRNNKYYVLAKG